MNGNATNKVTLPSFSFCTIESRPIQFILICRSLTALLNLVIKTNFRVCFSFFRSVRFGCSTENAMLSFWRPHPSSGIANIVSFISSFLPPSLSSTEASCSLYLFLNVFIQSLQVLHAVAKENKQKRNKDRRLLRSADQLIEDSQQKLRGCIRRHAQRTNGSR